MSVFLIPCPIAENNIDSIPLQTLNNLHHINHFIVERAKTARRFIKEAGHPLPIQDLILFELDKHNPENDLYIFLEEYGSNVDIGVISEAGCPGIADPGAKIVSWAHRNKIRVVPLVGPSSILLALMGSGFSGQEFTFHGYLPHNKSELIRKLRNMERETDKTGITQIFMETPYRNQNMVKICCGCLRPATNLCIAADITSGNEIIQTKTINSWKSFNPASLHKRPAIFLIGNV